VSKVWKITITSGEIYVDNNVAKFVRKKNGFIASSTRILLDKTESDFKSPFKFVLYVKKRVYEKTGKGGKLLDVNDSVKVEECYSTRLDDIVNDIFESSRIYNARFGVKHRINCTATWLAEQIENEFLSVICGKKYCFAHMMDVHSFAWKLLDLKPYEQYIEVPIFYRINSQYFSIMLKPRTVSYALRKFYDLTMFYYVYGLWRWRRAKLIDLVSIWNVFVSNMRAVWADGAMAKIVEIARVSDKKRFRKFRKRMYRLYQALDIAELYATRT